MDRHWRFVYEDRNEGGTGAWAWQVRDNAALRIASLCVFATLEACISHARESGFSFAQSYAIVFDRGQVQQAGS